MRQLLAFAWRWSWLPAACLVAVFAHWAHQTWRQYEDFGLRVDIRPYAMTLHDCGTEQFDHMMRSARIDWQLAGLRGPGADERRATIELFAQESALAGLEASLPYSGLEYVDARLRNGDEVQDVRLRLRGDTVLHWGHAKKSMRVRTRRSEPFLGMHAFNLVAPKFPEHLNNVIGARLAQRLGLAAPRTALVDVHLNGRYHGVHELVEQLDASTLVANGRAPGMVLGGEIIMLDAWQGIAPRLFERAGFWEPADAEETAHAAGFGPLLELVRLLNTPPTTASMRRLGELLDLEAFARLSVLEQLTQSHHDDQVHNWRLAWDRFRQRFEPIPWDLVGWSETMRPAEGRTIDTDPVHSTLHEVLHMDAGFLAARERVLREFRDSGGVQWLLDEVDAEARALLAAVPADRNLRPLDDDEVVRAIATFRAFVAAAAGELTAAVLEERPAIRWQVADGSPSRLLLELANRRAPEALEVEFAAPVPAGAGAMLLVPRHDAIERIDLGGLVHAQGRRLRLELPLVAELGRLWRLDREGYGFRNNRRQLLPTTVALEFTNVQAPAVVAVDALAGTVRHALERTTVASSRPVEAWFCTTSPEDPGELLWSGEVTVAQDLELRQPLRIAEGTVIRLAAGASLTCRARVQAAGTADQPIRFVPLTPGAPWGAVSLLGRGTAGSRLAYCTFEGGAGDDAPHRERPAALAVHDTDAVVLHKCHFRDNGAVDAALHAAYAGIVLQGTTIEGPGGTGIRATRSGLALDGCAFRSLGGDALQLEASRVAVVNSGFERVAGRALLAASGTEAVLLDARATEVGTALEAVDGSTLQAANCELVRCAVPARAGSSRRSMPGASVTVANSVVAGATSLPAAESRSSVTFTDCRVDGSEAQATLSPRVQFVDCDASTAARRTAPAVLTVSPALRRLAGSSWREVRIDVRGVTDGR